MGKKSIAVIVFIVVTIGFLYGFVTYNRQLREMLDKEISPQVVVMPDETEKPQPPVTEAPPISEQDTEETEEEEEETSELVVIPYIIGLHKEDAVKALEERNLVPEIHLEYVEGVEKEYVFYQRPPRSQEVPAGTTVSFSVSRGPYGSSDTETKVMMPIVMGKTRAQAEKVLVETGLLVKIQERRSTVKWKIV